MKFLQLPIGQRFGYNGKTYAKTGPLTASEEGSGNQQLIRKSVEVNPLELTQSGAAEARQFSASEVKALFIAYREQLQRTLIDSFGDQECLRLEQALETIAAEPLPPN